MEWSYEWDRKKWGPVFLLFHNYPPWKRAWSFISTNLNSLYTGISYSKFGWNWPRVLEKIVECCQCIFVLSHLSPLENAKELDKSLFPKMTFAKFQGFWRRSIFAFSHWKRILPFHLNKLESPTLKKVLCQVWLELGQRFWWKC